MEKDTKRKAQCFNEFHVDYVKQFSAVDIASAIQETLKATQYNRIAHNTHFNKDKNYEKPLCQQSFDDDVQWLIHGVFHKIGFYDYQK